MTGVQEAHRAPSRGTRRQLLAPPHSPGPALPVGGVPPGAPSPSAPARALGGRTRSLPHSHSVSTSSRGAISSASRCTLRRRRRSCCRQPGARRGVGGQGRGRGTLGQPAGGAQLAREGGAGAAGGRGARTRRRGPAASRAPALPARTRALSQSGRGGAPRQEGRRALATPTARRAPGRAAFKDANSALRLWTPEDRGLQGRLRPAAPPGSGFFPKPQAVSGAGGRAPGGGGVMERDCAASSVNRFFTGVVRKGPEG